MWGIIRSTARGTNVRNLTRLHKVQLFLLWNYGLIQIWIFIVLRQCPSTAERWSEIRFVKYKKCGPYWVGAQLRPCEWCACNHVFIIWVIIMWRYAKLRICEACVISRPPMAVCSVTQWTIYVHCMRSVKSDANTYSTPRSRKIWEKYQNTLLTFHLNWSREHMPRNEKWKSHRFISFKIYNVIFLAI